MDFHVLRPWLSSIFINLKMHASQLHPLHVPFGLHFEIVSQLDQSDSWQARARSFSQNPVEDPLKLSTRSLLHYQCVFLLFFQ